MVKPLLACCPVCESAAESGDLINLLGHHNAAIIERRLYTYSLHRVPFGSHPYGSFNQYLLNCSFVLLQAPIVIHTPHALPMFKEAKQIRKRKSERDHDDAVKFHKPEVGSSAATLGRGAAGLIGKTGGTLLTQYILKNHVSLCIVCPELCLVP